MKGADCSPLDFFGFGYLKNKVEKSNVKTLDGLWKKAQSVQSTISSRTCHHEFRAWKKRCRLIHERNGSHVEQTKEIRQHRYPLKELN